MIGAALNISKVKYCNIHNRRPAKAGLPYLGGYMRPCNLSDETQAVLKEILIEIEHIRHRANERCDYPRSDFPYRPCQAIVADKLGFEHRAEWHNDEYLGEKAHFL